MPKKNIDTINKLKMTYLSPLQYEPLGWRVYEEDSRDRTDGDFQRDYTRIMYSSSFRRLQGKMQLLGIKNDQFFRNRLTHSLEVAQIARSIAARIGYSAVDTYVVEAGALSHDLGNPPFGHYGERVLNEACCKIGGFEGNAQTLRILTTIEKKRPDFRGLNLTFRTLLSVTKYFNRFDNSIPVEDGSFNKQKFIYDSDYQFLKDFIDEHQVKVRTLDVQIVDIADEIAYAAHDLEDGLRQKLFNIDEILHDYEVVYGDSESFNMFKEIVSSCRNNASKGLKKVESSEYSKLFRKELVSSIIYTLIHDIDLVKPCDNKKSVTNTTWDKEIGFSTYAELSSGLKRLTFQCINHNDEVYFYEQMGGKIIKDLFKLYLEHPMYLPPEYRAKDIMYRYDIDENENALQTRLIADYIAGMMDSFAISTYKKFYGNNSLGSLF